MIKPYNQNTQYDVIVVGSGAAGCAAALSLAPLRVALVTAGRMDGDCSSIRTQGGLAAAIGAGDSPQKHACDTAIAGAKIVDMPVTAAYCRMAKTIAEYLEINGVQFDRKNGAYILSREGGHSDHRVLKAESGDGFGRAMMPVLWDKIRAASHIDIIDRATVCELLKRDNGSIAGVVYSTPVRVTNQTLRAGAVILATGGAAGLYDKTTNPISNTGRGIALAHRAGARLADLEFMQFHPTALDYIRNKTLPLLTEALRGHGAYLVNDRGVRFMLDIHADAELAPRDIVARAITMQINDGHNVYLDCRHIDVSGFETLAENAAKMKLSPQTDLIPVRPAAHYHMGGVATDRNGAASLDGLWVIGEAASTGFHGANRLASNSILEAIAMARNAASDIKTNWAALHKNAVNGAILPHVRTARTAYINKGLKTKIINAMRLAMTEQVGIIRQEPDLYEAQLFFEDIINEYGGLDHEIEDMAIVCALITRAARIRTESRGGHFRADFPFEDMAWQHRSFIEPAVKSYIKQEIYA